MSTRLRSIEHRELQDRSSSERWWRTEKRCKTYVISSHHRNQEAGNHYRWAKHGQIVLETKSDRLRCAAYRKFKTVSNHILWQILIIMTTWNAKGSRHTEGSRGRVRTFGKKDSFSWRSTLPWTVNSCSSSQSHPVKCPRSDGAFLAVNLQRVEIGLKNSCYQG